MMINSFMRLFSNPSTPISLFKGFITLLTLLFISTQQMLTTTIPIEQSAYEAKIDYEVEIGKISPSFKEIVCDINEKGYKNCALAKYKSELSNNFIDLLMKLHEVILVLMYIFGSLLIASSIAFLLLHKSVDDSNN